MFKKIANFYSQNLRIDLAPASILADLSPENETYRSAAERGDFVVCVAQGEPQRIYGGIGHELQAND
ncbi:MULTISPECIES: hypothetical protein [unclassified Sulfitobacter]|uniref:hypothetical protein n=1 Tax=unclassified Sulfitobacter TaxID=196795 RepID=UPI00374610FE